MRLIVYSVLVAVVGACSVDTTPLVEGDAGDAAVLSDVGTDTTVMTDTTMPPSCAAGLTDCGGTCVDLSSDGANCGACGMACPGGEVCGGGACAATCPSGLTECDGGCRDLTTDRAHCGACGNACASTEVCESGSCTAACDWAFQRMLSFDNRSRGDLDDFTVLVTLTSSRIDYAATAAEGADLRFTDDDGTTSLDYEVEHWNPTGRSYVWVRVPRIDGSSESDHIIMYYGNPGATAGARAAATWDASYEAVWHLGGTSDSTSNAHGLTDMGSADTNGRVGRARRFDGSGARLEGDTTVGSAADLTFELWMRSDVDTGFHRPIEKIAGSGTQGWSVLQRPDADTFPRGLIFRIGAEGSYGGWGNEVSASRVYDVDTWAHVVGTYDSATNTGRIYVDGLEVDVVINDDGRGVANTTRALIIGGSLVGEPFDGEIDEVRISTTARSADYVSAQYESQTDDLIDFGDEMPVGLACPE